MKKILLILLALFTLAPAVASAQVRDEYVESGRCWFYNEDGTQRNKLSLPMMIPSYQKGKKVVVGVAHISCRFETPDSYWAARLNLQRYNPLRKRWAIVRSDVIRHGFTVQKESAVVHRPCITKPPADFRRGRKGKIKWYQKPRWRMTLTIMVGNKQGYVTKTFIGPFGIFDCY